MTNKSIIQSLLQSLSGKTITDSKISDAGNLTLTFKGGDKITFVVNINQGINYVSCKAKPTRTEKLVKHGMDSLKEKSNKKKKEFYPENIGKIKTKVKKNKNIEQGKDNG